MAHQQEAALEVLQAQVEVLSIVMQAVCRAMPVSGARSALDEVRCQISKLAERASRDAAEEVDAQRAAEAWRVLSALGFAARGRRTDPVEGSALDR